MNLGNGKGSMSTAGSGGGRKAAEVVSDQFPAGLRVMVVDDDPTCLMILEKMLKTCLYEVTKCTRAEMALSLLRENKNGYDIVISDVHMPDMDGFKLLEHVGLEMDLPVIMMSADDGKNVVMKGVTHGACDYLIKPVRIEALRNIWQHVVRKKRNEWKDIEQSGSVEEGDRGPKQSEDADYSSSANEGNWRNLKRRKEEDDDAEERDDSSTLKKPRVVWSVELHQQFVQAVNQLGIDKAVPKKILELMNVPGLTRENVASHLQKYRLYLRRLSGVSQHPNTISNGYLTPQESPYGPLSSLNGLDLQALAATGQLPAQSLATLQAAGLARPPAVKSRVPMPVVDQRNLFSFENPKLRFADSQQPPPQLSSSYKQISLLHGIPTNLHHQAQSLIQLNPNGALNNQLPIQISQSQSRVSSLQSPILANSIAGGRGAGPAGYNFPANSAAELAASRFQVGSGNSGIKPSYDVFSELTQQKSHDWELDNILQGQLDVEPPVLSHRNLSGAAKPMFSGDATNHLHPQSVGQNVSSFFGGTPVRVKSELVTDSNLFPEQFEQDDLMSALLKQQQGAVGSGENEFDLDGYPLDNVPV